MTYCNSHLITLNDGMIYIQLQVVCLTFYPLTYLHIQKLYKYKNIKMKYTIHYSRMTCNLFITELGSTQNSLR